MASNRQFILHSLLFWTVHCSINALPSFLIAGVFLNLFQHSGTTIAMLLAILTFILVYTTLQVVWSPLHNSNSLVSRALKVALKIRSVISIVTTVFFVVPYFLLFTPDYWAGQLARTLLEEGYQLIFASYYNLEHSKTPVAIYLWTLTEGLILSLLLAMLSLFALIVLTRKNQSLPKNENRRPEDHLSFR